jgi:hypothetical protein
MTGKQEDIIVELLTQILQTLKKIKKDRIVRSKRFNG